IRDDKNNLIFTNDCQAKLKTTSCVNLACSADEKRVLVKHDKEDCDEVIKSCFAQIPLNPVAAVIKAAIKMLLAPYCEIYPKRSTAQTESAPPTVKPPSSADYNLPQFLFIFVA
ncbi:hypothetical protein, partial [Salmonella sp. s54412]|uniref:hypothetical protein n=1 Tax=Salmonella sp. s54412 TaxID=3160128 RepID=UPI0037552657